MNPFGYIKAAALSDVGRKRKNNEDNFGAFPSIGVWCVADGMGGGDDGEVASAAVVREMDRFAESFPFPPGGAYAADELVRGVADAVDSASAWIFNRSHEKRLSSCGSTIVGVAFDAVSPGKATAFHAGDSRLYRIRGKKIKQITKDHSAAELIGEKDESKVNPMFRGMVLRAVGVRQTVDVEFTGFDVKKGDRIVICSDGLSKMVPDKTMAKISSAEEDCAKVAESLVAAANEAGGADNITVIVLDVGTLPMALAKIPFPFERIAADTASTGLGTDDSVTQDTGEVTRMTYCADDATIGEAESQTADQADQPPRETKRRIPLWIWIASCASFALLAVMAVVMVLRSEEPVAPNTTPARSAVSMTSATETVGAEMPVRRNEPDVPPPVKKAAASVPPEKPEEVPAAAKPVPRPVPTPVETPAAAKPVDGSAMKPAAEPVPEAKPAAKSGPEMESKSGAAGKTAPKSAEKPAQSAGVNPVRVSQSPECIALAEMCDKERLSAFAEYVRRRLDGNVALDFSEQMKRASTSAQAVVRMKDRKTAYRFMVDFKYALQAAGPAGKITGGSSDLTDAWREVADGDVETETAVKAAVKVIRAVTEASE